MLRVCNLSSGSDGNCTYVEVTNPNEFQEKPTRLLIDAGISASQIVARLKKINVEPKSIDAIIISHEHIDHIKGLDVFASKYDVDVYAHKTLWRVLEKKLTRIPFLSNKKFVFYSNPFQIESATIDSVQVSHDAYHTSAFKVSDGKNAFSIITDLGEYDSNILDLAKGASVVYIESNHDEDMLRQNPYYPYHLKARILSKNGHLSNTQAGNAISYMAQNGTQQFVLAHLSTKNNSPDVAFETVCSVLAQKGIVEGKHIKIDIANTEIGTKFKIS